MVCFFFIALKCGPCDVIYSIILRVNVRVYDTCSKSYAFICLCTCAGKILTKCLFRRDCAQSGGSRRLAQLPRMTRYQLNARSN